MKTELISQYRAALTMLTDTIGRCPGHYWDAAGTGNAYWRIAYHTLHYTALYISENEHTFIPWHQHRPGYHILGKTIANATAYSKADLQQYAARLSQSLNDKIAPQNLDEPSGFDWIAMNKLELHLYNLRHLQHHTGQLVERLHQQGIYGISWVDSAH